jgi:phospholipid/cholesterol/gamma-HCH transport system substrate-binding protein
MRTIEISVGAFVLAGILCLVFLAFRVSGVGVGDTSGGSYVLNAKFNDVAGLRVRSKVSLAGVTIGRVAKIGVDSETAEAIVTMQLSQEVANLPVDTGARIQTEGFLGGRYISLIPGGEETVLHNGDTITNTQGAIGLESLIDTVISKMGSK